MKTKRNYVKKILVIHALLITTIIYAQTGVGINTTSPVSTLDVNGSFGSKTNIITASTTLDDTYSNVICNNATPIVITLPLANTCAGRVYNIKKWGGATVTVVRSGTNTIDATTSWLIDDPYEVVVFISDGNSAWDVMGQITPTVKTNTTGSAWMQGGNTLTSEKTLGLTSNFALPFITNNTERMRISAAGNVGIGHNAPGTILDVVDPSASNPTVLRLRTNRPLNPASPDRVNTIEFNENGSAANYGFTLDHYDGAGAGKQTFRVSHLNLGTREDMLTFTEQLNVGVGAAPSFDATYPEKFLVAAGTTTSVNAIKATGSINNYFQLNIQNTSTGNTASSDIVATANDGTETNYFVDLGINGSGYNSASFTIGDAHDGYLYSLGDDFAIGNAASGKDLKFFTNGTLAANERMRITSAGNVGIGITAPEQPLHVVKNTAGSGPTRDDVSIFETRYSTTTATSYYPTVNLVRQIPVATYVANSQIYGGTLNFGFRTPAAGTFMDIANIFTFSKDATTNIQFFTRTGMTNGNPNTGTLAANMSLSGNVLYIGNLVGLSSGVITDGNGNLVRGLSDGRFKKDLTAIDHPLEKVMKLKGYYYYYKDTARWGSQRQIGFIAQEMEKIIPEVVSNGTEYKSLNYQYLTALLAEAMKEQQTQIQILKSQNEAMQNKQKAMEDNLEGLLKQMDELILLK
jgi:hypothetical protein